MTQEGKKLVIVFHGWKGGAGSMRDVDRAIRDLWPGDVDVFEPRLAYANRFASERAAAIVASALVQIDTHLRHCGEVSRIYIVGHSVGATIARRVFLVASGFPPHFRPEKELKHQGPRDWAGKVDRLVMIAAFSRGWKVSERTSWYNSILFNFIGFIGQVRRHWSPTIFDFRLGAPFMVQTRLHWMAFSRQAAIEAPRPIIVQLIGTQDDLIAPFDQVDISVDGSGRALVPDAAAVARTRNDEADQNRDYFLIELPATNHVNAVELFGTNEATVRQSLFAEAMRRDRPGLHDLSFEPALLADEVSPIDRSIENVIFVIHGIRDDGFWTHRIAERIRHTNRTGLYRSWTPTYGYFAMLPFMLPWIRRQKVEWFMDQYVSAFAQYPCAAFHFVGHSNGTYLAARGFEDYDAFSLKRVLFAGSVVRCSYDWTEMLDTGRIEQFQNVCAASDWVVAFFPKSVERLWTFDLGAGGFDGFRCFQPAHVPPGLSEVKYVAGGHGAGILEAHWDRIAAFILDGTKIEPDGSDRFTRHPTDWIRRVGATRLVVPVGALLLFVVVPALLLCLHVDPRWRFEWSGWRVLALCAYIGALYFFITRV